MGDPGEESINMLIDMAKSKNLVHEFNLKIA